MRADGGTGYTKGTGFTAVSKQFDGGGFVQYQVQSSAGAITPSFSTTGITNHTFNSVTAAFKGAAAGTAPGTGIRIVHVQHSTLTATSTSPFKMFEFPSTGNLIVIATSMDPALDASAATDGNANTYTLVSATSNAGSTRVRQLYAANATTGTDMTGPSVTFATPPGGDMVVVVYDVTGAATSPFDTAAATTGNQADAGDLTTVSVTPTTSNGLLIGQVGIQNHAIKGSSQFMHSFWYPEADGGRSPLDEDNGWAHYYNPNTSQVTFVWQHTGVGVGGGVAGWDALAVAYKAPAAGAAGAARGSLGLMGVGR